MSQGKRKATFPHTFWWSHLWFGNFMTAGFHNRLHGATRMMTQLLDPVPAQFWFWWRSSFFQHVSGLQLILKFQTPLVVKVSAVVVKCKAVNHILPDLLTLPIVPQAVTPRMPVAVGSVLRVCIDESSYVRIDAAWYVEMVSSAVGGWYSHVCLEVLWQIRGFTRLWQINLHLPFKQNVLFFTAWVLYL